MNRKSNFCYSQSTHKLTTYKHNYITNIGIFGEKMNNIPNYLDSVILSDQLIKIEFIKYKENLNYGIFKIQKEDHTIGDLIQTKLLKEPNVIYSGYKQIHPLEHYIILKIITNGFISPIEAFDKVLKDLYIKFSVLEETLNLILYN